MLKILLLSPPIYDFYFTPVRKEPLGLIYIKNAIDKIEDVSVEIYDTISKGKVRKVKLPECFRYLKDIYREDKSFFSLFSNYYRFGDSFKKIIDRIKKKKYNIIGISALFSTYFPDVETLIRLIKTETRALVVVGGWAVSAEKERLFAESKADYFLLGSGEQTFPNLINTFVNNTPISKVPGIIYRKNKVIYSGPEPVEMAIPEEYPFRIQEYWAGKKRIAKVILSRGCSYKCDFCVIHKSHKFTIRSLKSIEKELDYLQAIGVNIVNFEDDNIFHSQKFTVSFISMLEKYHKKGLSYTAMNGITAINILPFVDQIIKAGFIEINLSLVTSNKRLSCSIKRPFSLDAIQKVVNKVQKRIKTLVFIIIGLPGSSPEMVLDDILELAKLPIFIGASPLYLVPGIPMFENMDFASDRRLLRGSALYTFDSSFSREDVASLWKFIRMINWFKKLQRKLSDEEKEEIFYFRKSVNEKTWYRKTKENTWHKSFSFKMKLPKEIILCKINGELLNIDF